jgi:hypothetical protein
MSLELIAIITATVISFMDLVINVAQMCLSGHCRSSCGCCSFEHDDDVKDDDEPHHITLTSSFLQFVGKGKSNSIPENK